MWTEARLQQECQMWANNTFKDYRGLFFMIDNSGKKSLKTASQEKAMGKKKGVPDTLFSVAKSGFHGLYVEFKIENNGASNEQIAMHGKLRAQGYYVAVIRTLDEFKTLINWYLDDNGTKNQVA